MILTADWHLTDLPQDEYRWNVFAELKAFLKETGPQHVVILGDICDKKDRHSATLVNRLMTSLMQLDVSALSIKIIMGNHDAPLRGEPFWNLLNSTCDERIEFFDYPHRWDNIMLFPFIPDPVQAWQDTPDWVKDAKAIFMHQPVDGAQSEGGFVIENKPMPIFPRGMKIYSGDIHAPQKIGRVQYVGAPHHIKFGDVYPCRMIQLDDNFDIKREWICSPQGKRLINITSLDELKSIKVLEGDQLKVRMSIELSAMKNRAGIEQYLYDWAKQHKADLTSVELLLPAQLSITAALGETGTNDEVLALFAKAEGCGDKSLAYALSMLKQCNAN